MIERSPHLKGFRVSVEFLHDMMTEGWEVGTTSIVRCVRGLPANAQFEYIHAGIANTIILVFSHPTWPAVADVPYSDVQFERIAREDAAKRANTA